MLSPLTPTLPINFLPTFSLPLGERIKVRGVPCVSFNSCNIYATVFFAYSRREVQLKILSGRTPVVLIMNYYQ